MSCKSPKTIFDKANNPYKAKNKACKLKFLGWF